jgi:uncharacterized protein (DUF4415 family)
MSKKLTSVPTPHADVPYDPADEKETMKFWGGAIAHTGLEELHAKRGRPRKDAAELKEQIALRVDKDVLEWYRALGTGWQTRMNAVLKAYRDASV